MATVSATISTSTQSTTTETTCHFQSNLESAYAQLFSTRRALFLATIKKGSNVNAAWQTYIGNLEAQLKTTSHPVQQQVFSIMLKELSAPGNHPKLFFEQLQKTGRPFFPLPGAKKDLQETVARIETYLAGEMKVPFEL